jgi:hypothetical protein
MIKTSTSIHSLARRKGILCLTPLLMFLFAGCGDGRPERVSISGQVLIDGTPLRHGYIRFIPAGARPSKSTIDSEGRFTLYCFDSSDGAVLGKHQVEVSGMQRLSDWKFRWHAPKKYADYRTSGLTTEVTKPNDALRIELTWAGEQPFVEVDESAKPYQGDNKGRR